MPLRLCSTRFRVVLPHCFNMRWSTRAEPLPNMKSLMSFPIFDGHNDILLRLFKRGGADAAQSFLTGEGKGQLDLPMARQGGFAGGLFAIFVPSQSAGSGDAPGVDLASAQKV